MAQTRKQKILGDVKRARRRRLLISVVIIAVLAVSIVAVIVLLPRSPPFNPSPISTTMQNYLTGVSDQTLNQVRSGTGVTPMKQISGSPLNYSGKPEFLYVGGEFCPFCASERWSMIVALSRFGTFSGLDYMMSADSPEIYPDTPTFTFVNAQYTSNYISFVAVEEYDRSHNVRQSLTSDQNNIVNTYDCYQGQCGSIAFIDIANKWVMGTPSNAGSQLQALGSQTCQYFCNYGNWTQIGALLNNPSSAVAQDVDGAANYLITAICNVDGGQPRSVCSQQYAGLTQAPIGATSAPMTNTYNMTLASSTYMDSSIQESVKRKN